MAKDADQTSRHSHEDASLNERRQPPPRSRRLQPADEFLRSRGLSRVTGQPPGDLREDAMSDVTVASFEEMEPIYEGLARRARATLGVTAFGMQVMSLPPEWGGYPEHHHDATMDDANQEEVYIPIAGSATLVAGEERFE